MSGRQDTAKKECFGQRFDEEIQTLLLTQYGLHLNTVKKSAVGAGSDTWFLGCAEGEFVLKFPAASEINHPELEPELCAFLRKNGIPSCDFVKNHAGSCVSVDRSGRVFTLQRHLLGQTLEWNSASETVLLESAELLGKIHSVLRNYPALPEGIGAGFFAHMTPQRALTSYRNSLATAIRRGDSEIAVCDYYGQYYASNADNREIYLQQARLATKLLKHMDLYIQREDGL